jgi:hypothetical protein
MNASLSRKGKRGSTHNPETALTLPNFLSAQNLNPFIDKDLEELAHPFMFLQKTGGKA